MTGEWRKSRHSNPSGNCVEVAVVTTDLGDGLGALRDRYPGWLLWRGKHTRSFWAMDRVGGGYLLSADTGADLEAKLRTHETT